MHPQIFQQYAAIEADHWWFTYQRRLAADLLTGWTPPLPARALDIGCGTGGNLPFLAGYCPSICGLDLAPQALAMASRTFPDARLIRGDINQLANTFRPESFSLITSFGVLYHSYILSETKAMEAIFQLLQPGGRFLMFDAAFPFLKRRHDQLVMGSRRFRVPQLQQMLHQSGFSDIRCTYWNSPSFLPALALAMANRIHTPPSPSEQETIHELALPAAWINRSIGFILDGERTLIRRFGSVPFGVSVACQADKGRR